MTLEDVFFKAAADRFDEVKLAGWGDLLKAIGAGYRNPATTNLKERLVSSARQGLAAFREMDPATRMRLQTQAVAVPVGAIAGYNMPGDYDDNGNPVGTGKRLMGAGLGILGGIGAGHLASRFAGAAPARAIVTPATIPDYATSATLPTYSTPGLTA